MSLFGYFHWGSFLNNGRKDNMFCRIMQKQVLSFERLLMERFADVGLRTRWNE